MAARTPGILTPAVQSGDSRWAQVEEAYQIDILFPQEIRIKKKKCIHTAADQVDDVYTVAMQQLEQMVQEGEDINIPPWLLAEDNPEEDNQQVVQPPQNAEVVGNPALEEN